MSSWRFIKENNRFSGHSWFSKESMRFFNCDLHDDPVAVDDGYLFISSEQDEIAWKGERRFTIRFSDLQSGAISTVGEFGQYQNLDEARGGLKAMLAEQSKKENMK